MGGFSIGHLLILAAIALLFFGPSRLPGLGKSLGEAIRGFKKGLDTGPTDDEDAQREQLAARATQPAAKEREKSKSET